MPEQNTPIQTPTSPEPNITLPASIAPNQPPSQTIQQPIMEASSTHRSKTVMLVAVALLVVLTGALAYYIYNQGLFPGTAKTTSVTSAPQSSQSVDTVSSVQSSIDSANSDLNNLNNVEKDLNSIDISGDEVPSL